MAADEFLALESRQTPAGLFEHRLAETDPEVAGMLRADRERQRRQLELVAPKNYMSRAVFEAHTSVVALTSVQGYPGRRMHAGTVNIDAIERLAVERARRAFGCAHANVQPHSGTQANQAVFFAVLEPGDSVLSLSVDAGGHLSHGARGNFSGRWFHAAAYGVDPATGLIDYDEAERLADELRPRLIITGGSAYPRVIDVARLREIADRVGAYLMVDIAHVAGQIAGGAHPSPFPHAHVVTASTNKNLRGPRGGLILTDDPDLGQRLDAAVFPGIQGGPLPEMICAKAVALGEALTPDYQEYATAVLRNARTLSETLRARGYTIYTGGTDTPLVIVDLRPQRLSGATAEAALDAVGITSNRILVPGDSGDYWNASGLRFGTSAITTRGISPHDMETLAHTIADLCDVAATGGDPQARSRAADRVRQIADRLPVYLPGDR